MQTSKGVTRPETRRDRARLSVRDPNVESLLGGLGSEGHNLDELRAFCKNACRHRNDWDISRRRTGLFAAGRIRKADAPAALKKALAALEGGAE